MPAPAARVEVNHPAYAPAPERDLVTKVMSCVETFERGIGVDFKERCENFYRLYRGFRKWRDAWIQDENDRDALLYDAKSQWGAHLHIPLTFRTIETLVPRAIAHRPRMLYLPRDERWQDNVENVRLLIDSQQEQIDIELEFQDVMRNGMIYGLGVGKVFWRKEWAARRKVKKRIFLPGHELGKRRRELAFDDPDFEAVDVFDFMWDPYGSSIRTCGWVVHRTWASLDVCLERIASGSWGTDTAQGLTEEEIRKTGSGVKYDEVWNERMAASGFPTADRTLRGEQIHEVLEWHDGHEVYTVLDRTFLVQDAENPCFGKIPFQVYRPTKLSHQMVGIGEVEPTQHLQRELDTLRSQRRDAATLALAAGYAYDSGAIDEEDLVFEPNAAIPVRNARVQDAIMPLQRQTVPGTAYQEEQIVRQDFDTVSGAVDGLGDGGAISTATEAQLVQAAVSKRIELKSRRFEVEVVRHAARCFLLLDQRMILEGRAPIRQPDEGLSLVEAAQAGRWRWFPIGPGELRGEFEIIPEGGSMAAENTPQKRQDALQIMQLFGEHPAIEPIRPILKALQLFDVKDPESWLKRSDPPVPQAALKVLVDMGVDPGLVQEALRVGHQLDPRVQGPNVQETDQMMGQEAMAA